MKKNKTLEEVLDFAISGLITDGAHHKQWYLEKIIETCGYNMNSIRNKMEDDGYSVEKGIAP